MNPIQSPDELPLPFGHTIEYEKISKQEAAVQKCALARAIMDNALEHIKHLGVTPKFKCAGFPLLVPAKIVYIHPEK